MKMTIQMYGMQPMSNIDQQHASQISLYTDIESEKESWKVDVYGVVQSMCNRIISYETTLWGMDPEERQTRRMDKRGFPQDTYQDVDYMDNLKDCI